MEVWQPIGNLIKRIESISSSFYDYWGSERGEESHKEN